MSSSPTERLLSPDRPLRLGAGSLRVLSGVVWITERGRPDDVFLQAGDCHAVRACRHVLAEGVYGPARVLWHAETDGPQDRIAQGARHRSVIEPSP